MYQELAVGHQREVGELVAVLHPPRLGQLGRLDRVESAVAQVHEAMSVIQSTCCSIDTIMLDSTDGLPGPVIMNRFGNPFVMRPR